MKFNKIQPNADNINFFPRQPLQKSVAPKSRSCLNLSRCLRRLESGCIASGNETSVMEEQLALPRVDHFMVVYVKGQTTVKLSTTL